MPAIATPTAARPSRSSLDAPNALRPPTPDSSRSHVPARGGDPRGRGGRLLFEVPFQNAMSDSDLAVLAQLLDLWTHMYPKMRPDPNSPGVARLDHFSGLFLERGAEEGMWVLKPAPGEGRQHKASTSGTYSPPRQPISSTRG